ncbi:MAG: ABC transporter permease [Sneathiellaceae bacterium]
MAEDAETAAPGPTGSAPSSATAPLSRYLLRLCIPAVLILAWILATTTFQLFPKALLPAPWDVVRSAVRLIETGELLEHVLASLERILYANLLALGLGVPLGLAMGMSRTFENLLGGMLSIFRPIPPLAWVPLAILWFGIGTLSIVFITFLAAFFAVLLNTIAGTRAVDQRLVRAAASLGAGRRRIVLNVVLPSVLPYIFTGARIAVGVSWMSIVAAELIAASNGLGYMISFYREVLRTDVVIVGMLTIGVIGLMMDLGSRWLENRLLPWRQHGGVA